MQLRQHLLHPKTLNRALLVLVVVPFFLLWAKIVHVGTDVGSVYAYTDRVAGTIDNVPGKEKKLQRIQKQWSVLDDWGFGIARRLDDASFWTIIALIIAATSVVRLVKDVGEMGRSTMSRRQFWFLLVCPCVVVIALYCYEMRRTNGTFWWFREDEPELRSLRLGSFPPFFWMVYALQVVEGLTKCWSIVICIWFANVGAVVARRIEASKAHLGSERHARALLNGCLFPFVAANLFILAYVALGKELSLVGFPSTTTPLKAFAYTAIIGLPFFVSLLWATYLWRNTFVIGVDVPSLFRFRCERK